MKKNIIKEKTFAFGIRIVKLAKHLESNKKEFVLSKQIKRSGTAPGALVREAEYAESTNDFIHKNSIALKEANETDYWLNMLLAGEYITQKQFDSLQIDCVEIIKILTSIVKTSKKNRDS